MRRVAFTLFMLSLAACDNDWKPASVVDSLRVIAVKAEPPEIKPGAATSLEALALDPTREGEKMTLIWLGCEPDPFGENRGACGDLGTVGSADALADAMRLPPGVNVIGVGNTARYTTQPSLFNVLPAEDTRRIKGTIGTIILVAIAADVPLFAPREELQKILKQVADKKIASQITLFRVRVSESSTPNQNPKLGLLSVEGAESIEGTSIRLTPQKDHVLDVTGAEFERYREILPSGEEDKVERIIVAWYTTAGRFDTERVTLETQVKTQWTAPGNEKDNDPIPNNRKGTLWAVARDTRGGTTWKSWPWFVCDANAPAPMVQSVSHTPPTMTVRGQNLDQILDLVANGAALPGSFDAAQNAWVGQDAASFEIRHKNCGVGQFP